MTTTTQQTRRRRFPLPYPTDAALSTIVEPGPLERPQEAPYAPPSDGWGIVLRRATLRALQAGWGLGQPARIVMVGVATLAVLALCWYVVLPVAGVVVVAVVKIAALVAALGAAFWLVGKVLGAPAVAGAAQQLGMVFLVVWLATLVLTARCTWRLARR